MAKLELGISREMKASSILYPRVFDSLDRQIIEIWFLSHNYSQNLFLINELFVVKDLEDTAR